MSGEIPTEETALAEVTSAVAFARNMLVGDTSFEPRSEDIDLSLQEAYVAIGSLFSLRGRSEELEAAVRAAVEKVAEEERVRAELLEKYGIGSDTEAVDIIAAYWQGDRPEDLERCIRGTYTTELGQTIYRQALQFAESGTVNDAEARQDIQNAQSLLWRGHTR